MAATERLTQYLPDLFEGKILNFLRITTRGAGGELQKQCIYSLR